MLLSIDKIKELYNEYLTTDKSLFTIAKENNINRVYMTDLFKKYCGYDSAIKKPRKHSKIVNDIPVDKYSL